MPAHPVLFIDDGGVLNDNSLRAPQWQRLVGEFFPPLLGGPSEAWAEANRVVVEPLWARLAETHQGRPDLSYTAIQRQYDLDWLWSMCDLVGVARPSEQWTLELTGQASLFITERVRSAFPGAADAVHVLSAAGYVLYTASGEISRELHGYLTGMGIRQCFVELYGADLVETYKLGPAYYERVFAHAGVAPQDAVVIDDSPAAVGWATDVGARTVLVRADTVETPADLVVARLADLPGAMDRLGR